MKLTPLDIKKQEFTRSFRGVDAQEVQSFQHMLAEQWGELLDENRRLEQKVRDLDSKLEHYRKIEEALQEALETARDNSHKTIENAQREAQIILKEARGAAEEMRKKASQDHKRLKHDITKISSRRDEAIARLRAFLMSELELLARFEGQDPIGFVRLGMGDNRQLEGHDYFERRNNREVRIDAAYDRAPQNAPEPAGRPVEEDDTFDEEPDLDPFYASDGASSTPEARFDLPVSEANRAVETPLASPGLSSDELEFIKSTVSTVTKSAVEDDIFRPAETKVKDWNPAPEPEPIVPEKRNPATGSIFARPQQPRTTEPFQVRPESPSNPPSSPFNTAARPTGRPDANGAGWVVKPAVPSPKNVSTPRNGGFNSPLFGPDNDADDLSATPEEIEKIRRILNDLD